MSEKLTRKELEELYFVDSKSRIAEIDNITREVETRMDDVREISARIVAGDVRSAQEIYSLTLEIENHLTRLKELRAKADALRVENLFDLFALDES